MKSLHLISLFKSNYCRIVFVASFFLGYFLLPGTVFHHTSRFLALVYLLVFASLMTCIVRSVKEKINLARKHKGSVLGTIAAILGFSAFQFCGVAAPVCGFSVGAGIVSAIFPSFLNSFFTENGVVIVYVSIGVQLVALYYLGCFRMQLKIKN